MLLSKGAQTEERGKFQETALSVAAQNGHVQIVSALLAHDACLDPTDKAGMTPLMRAAMAGHKDVLQLLLDQGAKVNVPGGRQTPLMFAVMGGNLSVARILLERGATVNATEAHGITALMRAVESGDSAMAQLLVSFGAELDARNIDGLTVFDIAGLLGNRELLIMLENFKNT